MTITVKRYTAAELEKNRRELLASVHMTADQLRERGRNQTLSPEERQVLREIENIDYLLGL